MLPTVIHKSEIEAEPSLTIAPLQLDLNLEQSHGAL